MHNKSALFQRTIQLIRAIPAGKILTYAGVSKLISAPGCARHISYILSSSSRKYALPWHRVINSKGQISLSVGAGHFEQKRLLAKENIKFNAEVIDLDKYAWRPNKVEVNKILAGLPLHVPLKARV